MWTRPGWGRTLCAGQALLFVSYAPPAFAAAGEAASGDLSLRLEAGPAFYRYEEHGQREFAGLRTEWADVGFRLAEETRYRTPIDLVPLLRFSFLTTAEDTETNNVGSPPTELRVAYFFTLQPGLQYELRPWSWLVLSPELGWDLDWYRQERDTDGGGVDESVFWHGPSTGFETVWLPAAQWLLTLAYRHSYLIDVEASNTFAEDLGFGSFSTDGQRDVVELRAARSLGPRWSADVGYRFESDRIDASDTKTRVTTGPDGTQTVQIQFPDNDHTIHAVMFSLGVRF
jgi:hypothetical protein